MSIKESTQLISASSYDVNNMIFSEPIVNTIPDSKPAISYRRINISTRNDDGSVGELIMPTEEVYSFGVSENLDQQTKQVNGYVMPLCLYNKNGPSQAEIAFVDTFNAIVEKCKDYLLDNKEDLELYDLEKSELKKLNPLYYKKEKGKVVEGQGPTLYAKLIVSKKQDKIITVMFDKESGEEINPLDLLGKYCYAKGAIKFESIFIGTKISLQIKLYECEVRVINLGMKRLLPRPEANSGVQEERRKTSLLSSAPSSTTQSKPAPAVMEDNDDVGSIIDDNDVADEEPEVKAPVVVKKNVKKVVTIKKKKDE